MNTVKVITIRFGNEIYASEVPLFRGAVNASMLSGHSCLFHNHLEDGYRYSYPLIQYKRLNKKAALVCIEQGAEVVGEFFNAGTKTLALGDRTIELDVESVIPQKILVQVWQTKFEYHIRNWLPLNSKNYAQYKALESLTDKIKMLERIMVGNILSMLKGLGIRVEQQVTCNITRIDEPRTLRYKNVKMMVFDLNFSTNVSIPNLVGLGKEASTGFGIVNRINQKNNDSETVENGQQ